VVEQRCMALTAEQGLTQMDKIVEDGSETLQAEASLLRPKLAKAMDEGAAQTSPLARLPKEKRAIYEHNICADL
jgi:hypothetical protein